MPGTEIVSIVGVFTSVMGTLVGAFFGVQTIPSARELGDDDLRVTHWEAPLIPCQPVRAGLDQRRLHLASANMSETQPPDPENVRTVYNTML